MTVFRIPVLAATTKNRNHMSAERLREMLSKAAPDESYAAAIETPRTRARDRLNALAPDAIALLADIESVIRTLEIGSSQVEDQEFFAAWLARLDALCGDDGA